MNLPVTSDRGPDLSSRPWSRRTLLQAMPLAFGGLSALAGAAGAAQAMPPRRAKACIFLFMWGGPSQLDTFDMKPHAPEEIRGEFQPVSTRVPGVQISEHFRQLSQRMDRVAVIRSLTHDDPAHLSSAHATLTGHLAPVVRSDAEPPSERDTPHLGSVISHLSRTGQWSGLAGGSHGLPPFVAMPWQAYHPAAPGGVAPGQHGGWLGRTVDPLLLTGNPSEPAWRVPALALQQGLDTGRLLARRSLLDTMERQQAGLRHAAQAATMTSHQSRAVDFLTSASVRDAFDLQQEPDAVRDRYGRNIHGQCVLLARRLVEHGVPLVSVNWHNDGQNFWDTHGNNFNRLKKDLIPPSDQALSALLDDLSERGLLDETIVAWVGEFGRRPVITAGNAGREHWPRCYSGLLAGGGIRGGSVFGSSDRHAEYPAESPVTPQDYAATLLHALGIPTDAVLHDRQSRPHQLYAGQPLTTLFG